MRRRLLDGRLEIVEGDGVDERLERSLAAFILPFRTILGLSVTSETGELVPCRRERRRRTRTDRSRARALLGCLNLYLPQQAWALIYSTAGDLPPTTAADDEAEGEGVHG